MSFQRKLEPHDPELMTLAEGGRMFLVTDISDKSTPKVVACDKQTISFNPAHTTTFGVGRDQDDFFYKHVTTFGVKVATDEQLTIDN